MVLVKDIQFAIRTFFRYPWTQSAAAGILALALAAVLSMLCIVDDLLWAPMHGIGAPERAVQIFPTGDQKGVDTSQDVLRLANAIHYKENSRVFDNVAWLSFANRVLLGDGEPEALDGRAVSGDFFALMQAKPLLGRLLRAGDSLETAGPALVLSAEYWRRRFRADPSLVGKALNLNGVQHTVVGVAELGFFAQFGGVPNIWLPYRASPGDRTNRETQVATFARLKEGLGLSAAAEDLQRMSAAIALGNPETDKGMAATAVPLVDVLARFRPVALALVFASLLVLGVASSNVANLLLAQAMQRTREFAIRQAIGASFWQIVRQWSIQVAVLMVLGVGLGTLIAHWAISAIVTTMPEAIKRSAVALADAGLALRPWLLTVAIAVSTTLLISVVPARQGARLNLNRALRDGGGGSAGTRKGRLTRRALVFLQVMLASTLTFGALCAYLRFVHQNRSPLGFEPSQVMELDLPNNYSNGDEWASFLTRLDGVLRLKNQAAEGPRLALVDDPPLTKEYQAQKFYREGSVKPEAAAMPWGKRIGVNEAYFSVMRVPVLSGRTFNEQDLATSPCVIVMSRQLERTAFQAESSVGRRIQLDSERTCEVIGTVADSHDVLGETPGDLYVSTRQFLPGRVVLLARSLPPAELTELRRAIRNGSPDQVIVESWLPDVVDASLWAFRTLVWFFFVLASVGLLIAALGTYAMMAHTLSVRGPEFGVRAALGAAPGELVSLVMKDSMPAGVSGVAAGIALSAAAVLAATQWRPDLWVYVTSGVLMMTLVGGSALLCARRVTLLSPATILRRR